MFVRVFTCIHQLITLNHLLDRSTYSVINQIYISPPALFLHQILVTVSPTRCVIHFYDTKTHLIMKSSCAETLDTGSWG